jgi:hypothetical protein
MTAAMIAVQEFLGLWLLPSRPDDRWSRRPATSIALRHAVWTRAVKTRPVSTKKGYPDDISVIVTHVVKEELIVTRHGGLR